MRGGWPAGCASTASGAARRLPLKALRNARRFMAAPPQALHRADTRTRLVPDTAGTDRRATRSPSTGRRTPGMRPAIRQVVAGAPAADERLLDRGGIRTSPDDELVTSLEATELLVLRGHRSFHTPVAGPDVQHRFAPNPSVNNRLLPPRPVARLRHHQRRSQLRSEGRERISHGAAVA